MGPRNSQVGQSLFSEFARLVHTIVGPERLATIEMVVLINRMLIRSCFRSWVENLHFTGFDPRSFCVWPFHSKLCAIESQVKSLVESVDPMATRPNPIICSIVPPLVKAREQCYRGSNTGLLERESQNGPMNNGPQKFSGWSKSLLRVCTFGSHNSGTGAVGNN